MQPLILVGAGGHAKVVLALARSAGHDVIGVCAPELAAAGMDRWRDVRVLGGDEALAAVDASAVGIAIGVGQTPRSEARRALYARLQAAGFRMPALVHPSAIVDATAVVGEGAQIMAGAVLQADCVVGRNTTINTGARIDHDCVLGAHVHIAPGATLCGGVTVGEGSFIGCGATVIQGISIGAGCLLGAGAILRHPLDAGLTQTN